MVFKLLPDYVLFDKKHIILFIFMVHGRKHLKSYTDNVITRALISGLVPVLKAKICLYPSQSEM